MLTSADQRVKLCGFTRFYPCAMEKTRTRRLPCTGTPRNHAPLGGKILQGKELSYNNLLDLDAAWRAVTSFTDTSVVIVKHLSPCGIASADRLVDAYQSALACDPVSAYGGIVACNVPLDVETAMEIKKAVCRVCHLPRVFREVREISGGEEELPAAGNA